jgi:hypothetical protein
MWFQGQQWKEGQKETMVAAAAGGGGGAGKASSKLAVGFGFLGVIWCKER